MASQPRCHCIDADRGTEQQPTQSLTRVLPRTGRGVKQIGPKDAHHQAHRGDGDQACGFIVSISNTHFLIPPLPLIGYAIPNHYGQLDAHNGHDDNEKIPTPDMVDVKAIGKETDSRDAADDPGETCGLETVVQETFIDQRTDDRDFHFLLSSVKI
jgi:hypothetical protein